MIIYFADSNMDIYAMGTTELRGGMHVYDDVLTQDAETGAASFEAQISGMSYAIFQRIHTERTYILRSDDKECGVFTVLDADLDNDIVYVYAEDAGLDLLNDLAPAFSADGAHNIEWYVNKYIADTGFEIGENTATTATKQLTFSSEQTRKARIDEIALDFGAEISFSFLISGLTVIHMYINLHGRRGADNGTRLRVGHEIKSLRIKTSVAEIATGLIVVGGTPEGSDIPVNLSGYSYDDGDFYTSGNYLYSRQALIRWARYAPASRRRSDDDLTSHIIQRFDSNSLVQATLCSEAVTALKERREPRAEYEAEVLYLPEGTGIGDTVYIVDNKKELYIRSRIVKIEKSCSRGTLTATLGNA